MGSNPTWGSSLFLQKGEKVSHLRWWCFVALLCLLCLHYLIIHVHVHVHVHVHEGVVCTEHMYMYCTKMDSLRGQGSDSTIYSSAVQYIYMYSVQVLQENVQVYMYMCRCIPVHVDVHVQYILLRLRDSVCS